MLSSPFIYFSLFFVFLIHDFHLLSPPCFHSTYVIHGATPLPRFPKSYKALVSHSNISSGRTWFHSQCIVDLVSRLYGRIMVIGIQSLAGWNSFFHQVLQTCKTMFLSLCSKLKIDLFCFKLVFAPLLNPISWLSFLIFHWFILCHIKTSISQFTLS